MLKQEKKSLARTLASFTALGSVAANINFLTLGVGILTHFPFGVSQ